MASDDQVYAEAADQLGFGRYSMVLHAPAELADKVQRFRAAIGMAHVVTPPHVSVVSHLSGLVDRDELLARLGDVAGSTHAMPLTFAAPLLRFDDTSATAAIVATPELTALRSVVLGQLAGLFAQVPAPGSRWYAHLTIYQGGDAATRARAEQLASTLDLSAGFKPGSLDLVGRLGVPPGGRRSIIAALPFAAG